MGDFLSWIKKKSSSTSTSHGSLGQKASSSAKPQEKAQPSLAASSSAKPQEKARPSLAAPSSQKPQASTSQSSLKDDYQRNADMLNSFDMNMRCGTPHGTTPKERYQKAKREGRKPPESIGKLLTNDEYLESRMSEKS